MHGAGGTANHPKHSAAIGRIAGFTRGSLTLNLHPLLQQQESGNGSVRWPRKAACAVENLRDDPQEHRGSAVFFEARRPDVLRDLWIRAALRKVLLDLL